MLGTPEFMAPEIYEEKYNTLRDIVFINLFQCYIAFNLNLKYAFGMSVLEMCTL